jgi:3-deoxy-7-phosphoheptulonate synthase
VDAILVAAQPHIFPTVSFDGRAMIVASTGNPHGHLILRGSEHGQNYDAASVRRAADELTQAGLPPRLIVDCSHGNSSKDYRRQPEVAACLADQIALGSSAICGVMLESHLVQGRQSIVNGWENLHYGQSVTDGCIGWEETVTVLDSLAEAVRLRRKRTGEPPAP